MSALEKLIQKIDGLCQKIELQKEEIQTLKDKNQELELSLAQQEEKYSQLLAKQSSEEGAIEALFERMERALNE